MMWAEFVDWWKEGQRKAKERLAKESAGHNQLDMAHKGDSAQDMSLEQRYQQLEQVAKRMLSDLDSLVCTVPGLSADGVRAYRQQLEALGVSLDD